MFDRPVPFRPELRYVNDGGTDAPLSERGRFVFRATLLSLLIVFVVLLVISVR